MQQGEVTTVALSPGHGRRALGKPWLPAGWPLTALFVGFPLWWALGGRSFAFLLAAVPMAVQLLRRDRLIAPRWFGLWLLFLVTVIASGLVLGSSASLAVPGGGSILTFSYRLAWYVALTVVLLYVVNLDEHELPTRKVTRLLGLMFIVTVAGGYLGMLAPHFEFDSLLERVTPASLAGNTFFRSVTHPVAAQVQNVLGFDEARPAAPFGHSNDWGANLGLLLPFFLLSWTERAAGWRRHAVPFVLVAALVPIVYSLNRGLWLGLVAMAVFVALRLAASAKFWALGLCAAALVVSAVVIVATPLGAIVTQRFENPHSNEARANLSSLTVRSTLEGSPIIGYGSTRDVPGNFNSIAGGATEDCRRCSPPAMGTQGHAWLVLFSQGLVGFVLFFGFLAARFFASWRDVSPVAWAGLSMFVFLGVTVWFYDLLEAPLFVVMIAVGLMWRSGQVARAGRPLAKRVVWSPQ